MFVTKVPDDGSDEVKHVAHLIIVQQDATYSVYYMSVGSSTCFGF